MMTDPTLAHRPAVPRGLLVKGAAVLVLVLVAVIAFRGGGEQPDGTSIRAGSFALPALDGSGTVKLSDHEGKPVVVNLYASWCSVCDLEMPDYATASEQLKGEVTFIGVASMETGDAMLMPKRHGIDWWPLARDVGGSKKSGLHDELARGFGMPVTAFYDEDGTLLRVKKGGLVGADLADSLAELYDAEVKL
jgi:thiol-disulfide isomerase/thioredoxin